MYHNLDVLLVNPGTELEDRGSWNREPPVGLLYLVAVLEQAGYTCQIIDMDGGLTVDDLEDSLESLPEPLIIGFTSLTNTINRTFKLIDSVKGYYSSKGRDPVLVMGGPHATFTYEQLLHDDIVDFIFIGEGEGTIVDFVEIVLEHVNQGQLKRDAICNALQSERNKHVNVAFKDANGETRVNDSIFPGVKNISNLPFPARYLYPFNKPDHVYETATIIANRGCPNQCIFCSRQALFLKARWREPENLLDEIREIHQRRTYEYYNIYDNLTISPRFLKDFLGKLAAEKKFHLPWGAELRVDMIDDEAARLLKRAGCRLAATGIESANPEILKIAGKFQSIEKVREGLERIKAVGIPVQAYFIVGLPGETRSTFNETIAFIKDSPLEPGMDTIDFFAATPYPGSRLHERKDEYGIEIFNDDMDEWDCQHLVFSIPTLDRDQLDGIWKEAKAFENGFNSALKTKR
ncbi:MAG: B12-binding domain-containing radical SAM protein [Promethearchaeota archaeon]